MEIIYNTGPVTILKDSGKVFTIYNSTLNKPDINIIGSYLDKDYMFKRVTKDSSYGKVILQLLSPPEEELTRDEKRLRELISTIGKKI